MHWRYQDLVVNRVWSTPHQYKLWLDVERAVAWAQYDKGIIPREAAAAIAALPSPGRISIDRIHEIEQSTQHDVAAFLQWAREEIGDPHAKWLHYGLTSSDVVDTALGIRFRELHSHVVSTVDGLLVAVDDIARQHQHTPCLGRTHGQPAEQISLGARASVWRHMLNRTRNKVATSSQTLQMAKIGGPVGDYRRFPAEMESTVAGRLGLTVAGPGHSQVVSRDMLADWANATSGLIQAMGKVAIDFRLMASHGEVSERWPGGRIGSSSMPHKRNPVTAEKISGMGRLALGYALALQPVDLWEERDISHSCVERVAIPDLLHLVLHCARSCTEMLFGAEWNTDQMLRNLDQAGKSVASADYYNRQIREGQTAEEARAATLSWIDKETE